MADLGNLWFSLGLDDSKFEKQWRAALTKYGKDAKINIDFSISSKVVAELKKLKDAGITNKEAKNYASLAISIMKVASAQEKYNQELTKTKLLIQESNARVARQDRSSSVSDTNRTNESLERQALTRARINKLEKASIINNKHLKKEFYEQALWVQNLKNIAANYFSIYAVRNFVTEVATVTGEFEKQRVTLQAMIGEMEGLDIYRKMKELAVVSPFEFKDLASYAKQLAAFSMPYEELYDTTKRLADISAGLGVGMDRIILAYGQIKSAGVLKGTELRQLTEAGVPILEKLQQKLKDTTGQAVSMGDVFDKVSKKAISFKMVKEVFEEMTSAGGKFYNMQEVQAEPLSGKISNLKDAYSIMLTEIGEKTDGALRFGVEKLYDIIDNWEALGRVVVSVATAYGALQAVKIGYWIATQVKNLKELITSVKVLRTEMTLLSAMTKSGAWGAIAFVVAGIGMGIWQAVSAAKEFNKELSKISTSHKMKIDEEVNSLNQLTSAIKDAAAGSKERRDLVDQMNSRYGTYLGNLLEEKNVLDNIASAHDAIATAIHNRYEQEALLETKRKIDEEYGQEIDTLLSNFKAELIKKGNSATSSAFIKEFVKKAIYENIPIKNANDLQKVMEESGKFTEKQITDTFDALVRGQVFERDIFGNLKEAIKTYYEKLEEGYANVSAEFAATGFDSEKRYKEFEQIKGAYEQVVAYIEKMEGLSPEEVDKRKKAAEIKYLETLKDLYKDLPDKVKEYDEQLKKLNNTTKDWRTSISSIVGNYGFLAPKEEEGWTDYVGRLQKEYKKIKDDLLNLGTDPAKMRPELERQKSLIESISKLYQFSADGKTADEIEKERVNALKEESQWILKLYESYKKYLGQDLTSADAKKNALADFIDIPEKIKSSFEKDADISEWFRAEWSKIAEDAKSSGSDIGVALANGLLLKLGTINTGEVLEFLKLGEKIQKELEKWGLGDFVLMGEGAALDLSKIARDYAVTDNEIAAKKKELLNQVAEAEKGNDKQIAALKEKYGEDWEKKARERIERLTALEKDNNRKIAEDKVYDLAKTLAKEDLENTIPSGFLQSLGDKSTEQLKEMQSQLAEMATDIPEFIFSNQFTDQFADLNIDWDKFIEKYQEYIKLQGKDVSDELLERKREELHDLAGAISETIGMLKELAGEDSAWGGFLSGLDDGAKAAISISEAFTRKKDKDGNLIGGLKGLDVNWTNLASAVAGVVTSITSAIIESKRYQEEMERAGNVFSASIIQSKRDIKIAGEEFNTIFGEDLIGALQADQEAITSIITDLKRGSKEVANIKILTKKGIFGIGRKETTLKDLAPQLFKADGSVNYEYLDEFLNAYGDKLNESQKAILENLKSTYEQYESAMSDVNDYLSDIFSDTASTIADRMIDAFAATGNAATDLGDLVSGVAKQMAKDLIQSMLVDQYLTPAMERIKSLYNLQDKAFEQDTTLRTQKAILAMQDAIASAQEAVPEVNKLLEAIQAMGIDLSKDASNASEVLSGLTEDQQNLLMGYINGIRADVSYNKGLLLNVVNSVGTINNNIATALIVWKQIEANTHRSADGVDKIVDYFESVTGPYDGGGGQAFRVNIA